MVCGLCFSLSAVLLLWGKWCICYTLVRPVSPVGSQVFSFACCSCQLSSNSSCREVRPPLLQAMAEQLLQSSSIQVGHLLSWEVCWESAMIPTEGILLESLNKRNAFYASLQVLLWEFMLSWFSILCVVSGNLTCMIVKDTIVSHQVSCILLFSETVIRTMCGSMSPFHKHHSCLC